MTKSDDNYQEFDKSPLAQSEERILEFWRDNNVFQKSLEKESPQGEFVFYEGPPTANGRPGIHHLESRAFKDAIPRYKTMQGYHVDRRAGWDTHGLPVELEVEKQLGFNGKPDIEQYGIAQFNQKCRESVLTYVDEWQAFTDRIAYWVDHDRAYYTFEPDYMESVWWVFSQAQKNGLLYKDYKVLPWCSRCGTALSSHELAQGYKDVKDLSVTAKFELVDPPVHEASARRVNQKTYILAWTTTPWTLPGNVALAVGQSIKYSVFSIKYEDREEKVILAKDRADEVLRDFDYTHIADLSGSDLVGKKYKPLYPYFADLYDGDKTDLDKAYQIYAADFVTTEDGTGVVHTAVMYGQDDFVLGSEIGLPKFHLVNPEGHFIPGTDFLADRFVKDEQVAIDIIKDLAHRGLLFSKEKYEHSYPHCWRCKTPLIYYARDSWYIAMSNLRDRLLENNNRINWEPDYIKEGRMGEWLRGVKDWAVSRERYWGTPLPIWESADGDRIVVDSIDTLKKYLPKTKFIFVRHAEGEHNVQDLADANLASAYELTDRGREQAKKFAATIEQDIDVMFCSPILRSCQTAEIIAAGIGYDEKNIQQDQQICEINFGEFDQGPIEAWKNARYASVNDYTYTPKEGESFIDVKHRVGEFMKRVAAEYVGKTVLVVTHGAVLETAKAAAEGMNLTQAYQYFKQIEKPVVCSQVEVDYYPLPKDEAGELNLHRPYIDEVILEKDGKTYRRVSEVMDVWFDSGSMPWAQQHFPFGNVDQTTNNKQPTTKAPPEYPGDYISEAIDQTRGWFYVLQAIAAFMGLDQAPYKNVICLGHILDAEGQKMSKSRGNTVNPWEMIAKYGADALRFWMYSVNQPGEPKNFDEKTVDEIVKKVFNLLRNSVSFYQMFAADDQAADPFSSPHVLDRWLLSRYGQLQAEVTNSLDNYKLLEATRALREFIADLSQWYIRRSRDRFKGSDEADLSYALSTTHYVLQNTARLMAPFTPYLADELWIDLRRENDPISVHLSDWPDAVSVDQDLLKEMDRVREVASVGLALRNESGINARQPLAKFTYQGEALDDQLAVVLADELNVKEVIAGSENILDTALDNDLIAEGEYRELLRKIQATRKQMDLVPADRVTLYYQPQNKSQSDRLLSWQGELEKVAGVVAIEQKDISAGEEVQVEGEVMKFIIVKS